MYNKILTYIKQTFFLSVTAHLKENFVTPEGYKRCGLSTSWVTMGPDVPRGLVRHPMSPAELT